MILLPPPGYVKTLHNLGAVGAAIPGTSVTTGASSGTKGSPAEVFTAAQVDFDVFWVTIFAQNYGTNAAASACCLDLLGGAATEDVLIANLLAGYCGTMNGANGAGPKVWHFPLYIPGGTRIAVQAAGERTSTAFTVGVYLHGGNNPLGRVATKVTTYGVSSVPQGQNITPGASAAEGSWAQITSATTEDHWGVVPSFQCHGDTGMGIREYSVDIGIGAAAAEEQISEGWFYNTDAIECMGGPLLPALPCFFPIPNGSRLAMRGSCNNTIDSAYDGALHCLK